MVLSTQLQDILVWPFRSEFHLFLTMSSISLIICFIDFFVGGSQADVEANAAIYMGTQSEKQSDPLYLDSKLTFLFSVGCLFSIVFFSAKVLFRILFGHLTDQDKSQLTAMCSKFILLRLIILWGAIDVFRLSTIFGWLVWFCALGLLHGTRTLLASRCARFAASSRISQIEWVRVIVTFSLLLAGNWFLFTNGWCQRDTLVDVSMLHKDGPNVHSLHTASGLKTPTALGVILPKLFGRKVSIYDSMDILVYICLECVLLLILTVNCISEFMIQLYDRWKLLSGNSWPQQASFTYYLDLIHVTVYQFTLVVYYIHLLLWSRLFSVTSLLFFHHIRSAYTALLIRLRRHLSYRLLVKYVNDNFKLFPQTVEPNSTPSDGFLASRQADRSAEEEEEKISQTCAICWDSMSTWRRLPCNHDFHDHCLRNWLEQNPTCPTCRRKLHIPTSILPSTVQHQPFIGSAIPNLLRRLELGGTPSTQTGASASRARTTDLPSTDNGRFSTTLNIGFNIGSVLMGTSQERISVQSGTEARDESQGPGDSTLVSSTSTSNPPSLAHTESSNGSNGQVHHRTFHFDGSRYLSWLPSFHIELSQVIREVFSGGIDPNMPSNTTMDQVMNQTDSDGVPADTTSQIDGTFDPVAHELIRLPQTLRGPAQELAAMFPQFSMATVVADLLITRVPEVTVENLIRLPIPTSPRPWTLAVPSTSTQPVNTAQSSTLPSDHLSLSEARTMPEGVENVNQESTIRSRAMPDASEP